MESAIQTLQDGLREDWQHLVRLAPRVLVALVILALSIWIGRIVGGVVIKILERAKLTQTHRRFFRHVVVALFGLLGLVIALNVLGLQAAAAGLLAGGGITAVALGFAFRGIGENFLAGLFLAFSRPFEVGDLIQSREFQGQVRGIELRCTHIRTADGRDVYIPSSQIFNEAVINFTRDGLRRLSFTIGVDHGDDTERARALLLDEVRGVEQVLSDPAPFVAISAMQPQYQELEVSFWIDVFKPSASLAITRSTALGRCRRALKAAGFTMSSEVTTGVLLDVVPGAATRAGSLPPRPTDEP